MKNDIIIMDKTDSKYRTNLFLKKIANRFMMINIHQFLMCLIDNYLEYGFSFTKRIMLDYTINDILTKAVDMAPNAKNILNLEKVKIIFGNKKIINYIKFNKKMHYNSNSVFPRRHNEGLGKDTDYVKSGISIPIRCVLYTKNDGKINVNLKFIIITYINMNLIDIKSRSINDEFDRYKTRYDCKYQCKIGDGKQSKKLQEMFSNDKHLLDALICTIKTCLTNEIGNFIFQEIYSNLMNSENTVSQNVIYKLRNTECNININALLEADEFEIEEQCLKHKNILHKIIDPVNLNLIECIMGKVFEKYRALNYSIIKNNKKLIEKFKNAQSIMAVRNGAILQQDVFDSDLQYMVPYTHPYTAPQNNIGPQPNCPDPQHIAPFIQRLYQQPVQTNPNAGTNPRHLYGGSSISMAARLHSLINGDDDIYI